MKIMFDKTSKDTPSQQEPALDFNPVELSAIESEGFNPQKFQSTRKVKVRYYSDITIPKLMQLYI